MLFRALKIVPSTPCHFVEISLSKKKIEEEARFYRVTSLRPNNGFGQMVRFAK